jgi:hypothetical protein
LATKASFNHPKTFIDQRLKDEVVGLAGTKVRSAPSLGGLT